MFLYLSARCNDLQVELLIHIHFIEVSGYMLFVPFSLAKIIYSQRASYLGLHTLLNRQRAYSFRLSRL